jgi:hypothetical protein
MEFEFNVAAIREKAFRRIQNDVILFRKWNDAKTERDREVLITEQVIKITAEYCIDETYANHDDAFAAIKVIKYAIEQMDEEN